MMDSTALKGLDKAQLKTLRKMYAQDAAVRAMKEARELLENPIIEYSLGSLFIAWLFRPRDGEGIVQTGARILGSAGMSANMALLIQSQQLGKSLPALASVPAVSNLIGGLLLK